MTTLDSPSLSQFLVHKLGRAITERKEAKATKAKAIRTLTWFQSTIRLVLHLAGFASLTYAGFVWDIIAGLVVGGICCFILSSLITPTTPTSTNTRPPVDPMATRR